MVGRAKGLQEIPKVPDIHGEMWIPFSPVGKGGMKDRKNTVPKKIRDAEHLIREFVASHNSIKEPLIYPIEMAITCYFQHTGPANVHVIQPDICRLGRLICDALGPYTYTYLGQKKKTCGILYVDDSQICSLTIRKFWHKDQGILIRWKTLGAPDYVYHPLDKRK